MKAIISTVEHDTWCDGYATAHSISIEHNNGMKRVICADCGPVTPYCGNNVTDDNIRAISTCQTQWVSCTGQCLG